MDSQQLLLYLCHFIEVSISRRFRSSLQIYFPYFLERTSEPYRLLCRKMRSCEPSCMVKSHAQRKRENECKREYDRRWLTQSFYHRSNEHIPCGAPSRPITYLENLTINSRYLWEFYREHQHPRYPRPLIEQFDFSEIKSFSY